MSWQWHLFDSMRGLDWFLLVVIAVVCGVLVYQVRTVDDLNGVFMLDRLQDDVKFVYKQYTKNSMHLQCMFVSTFASLGLVYVKCEDKHSRVVRTILVIVFAMVLIRYQAYCDNNQKENTAAMSRFKKCSRNFRNEAVGRAYNTCIEGDQDGPPSEVLKCIWNDINSYEELIQNQTLAICKRTRNPECFDILLNNTELYQTRKESKCDPTLGIRQMFILVPWVIIVYGLFSPDGNNTSTGPPADSHVGGPECRLESPRGGQGQPGRGQRQPAASQYAIRRP